MAARHPLPGHYTAQPPPSPPRIENRSKPESDGARRSIGLGLITGAADNDPSAIGTYATAGAKFGPSFLWAAPVAFPMMIAVVYLSSKLGLVGGEGLFAKIRTHCSRWILYPALVGVLISNTIEAGADLGGMAAALRLLIPVPTEWIVVATTLVILTLQLLGSYSLIRNIFRWLALALLAYIGSAALARPDFLSVLKGTFIPTIHFNREFFQLLVAVIGTSLSAYLYTWQSNMEVEEAIARGRTAAPGRREVSDRELKRARWDTIVGMLFASIIMYFIILSTGSTLFHAGKTDISTAAEAAQALRPLAGDAAGLLFAIGVVAVGFLAVPVMTIGAAYDLAQTFGWKNGLYAKPSEAKKFYAAIFAITLIGMSLNFFGINPMKALVWAGIVQGLLTPPLMLLIMLMTNNKTIMGERVNSRPMNVLGWITTIATFAAGIGLLITWIV